MYEQQGYIPTTHDVPKCTSCGFVGPWKVGALFTPLEIIIAIVFLCLGVVPGLIYIGIHIARYGSKSNRPKYCTRCKAKNMFTFLY